MRSVCACDARGAFQLVELIIDGESTRGAERAVLLPQCGGERLHVLSIREEADERKRARERERGKERLIVREWMK